MSKPKDRQCSNNENENDNNNDNCKKSREDSNTDIVPTLKITTTKTSDYFFLPKFDSQDVSNQERFPKNFTEFDLLIDKIYYNLEETENVFINQAKEVIDRDIALINQRAKLENLQDCLLEKKKIHEGIDQTVEFIANINNDLQNIVKDLEKKVDYSADLANGLKFTPDRTRMFDLMLKMNIAQKDMLQNVSDSICMMNDAIENSRVDPIGQITQILNLHIETLDIMERKTKELEEELRSVKSLREYYVTLQTHILSCNH